MRDWDEIMEMIVIVLGILLGTAFTLGIVVLVWRMALA